MVLHSQPRATINLAVTTFSGQRGPWAAGWTLLFACLAGPLLAHDPGLSTATIKLRPDRLEAQLTFARADLETLVKVDADRDGKTTVEELSAARPQLEALAAESLGVRFQDEPASVQEVRYLFDENNNFQIDLTFAGEPASPLVVHSRLLDRLPPGHRQFLSLQDGAGKVLAEVLLSAKEDVMEVDLRDLLAEEGPVSAVHSSGDFLLLGVRHILTGYDHLLFLFGLLIVIGSFRSAVAIITCFTIAHSITLAVATFDLVQMPGRVVEPLIAVTIIYVGLENLVRRDGPKGRWRLTLAFGLVHGFGFASVLRELGVGSGGTGVVVPLVAFNLGVETGQVMIASMALPLIWWLRTKPVFVRRWVPACSAAVALAGGYWLIQRTLL